MVHFVIIQYNLSAGKAIIDVLLNQIQRMETKQKKTKKTKKQTNKIPNCRNSSKFQ